LGTRRIQRLDLAAIGLISIARIYSHLEYANEEPSVVSYATNNNLFSKSVMLSANLYNSVRKISGTHSDFCADT
jgi:hypothetical protein